MRKQLLASLMCINQDCKGNSFSLMEDESNSVEIVNGTLKCNKCGVSYKIENGIVNFLCDMNKAISREREAMDADDYIKDKGGNKYKINAESIRKFSDVFFALPEGDGSYFFKRGGSFQTIAEASDRFYSTLDQLRLTGREKILEIGASFSYASFKFAQKGCSVVATDISNYLKVSGLFVGKAYYDRMFSDMHNIPFIDNTFDMVFAAAVLHHSKNLKKVFSEIYRVLKPGGRLVLINETSRGVLERIHPVYKEMEEKGYGDTAYTLIEWSKAARGGGFKNARVEFLSLAADYVTRRRNRGAKVDFKLRLAYFLKKHQKLERFLLWFTILPRMLTRPKSWRLICYKDAED
ncbi:MAG: methyltransferase domain-containing protein [Candidatus Omnitrophota bacterium]